MWNKFIRDYFTFSRKERNGLTVLFLIMLFITFWPGIYSKIQRDDPTDFSEFQQAVDSFQKSIDQEATENKKNFGQPGTLYPSHAELPADQDLHVDLKPFDPNMIDEEAWKNLGVPSKTIKTIMNYRSKGGKFRNKEDLRKIYGFRQTDYERLEPYIEVASVIPDAAMQLYEKKPDPAKAEKVELNTADSVALVELQGIGPVLASRVLKFRNSLGGFIHLEQLGEIYGLEPESLELISKQLTVDHSVITKININTVELAELKKHPYFRNPLASLIISYRSQHGSFNSLEELKNIDLIDDVVYSKIIPYLSL